MAEPSSMSIFGMFSGPLSSITDAKNAVEEKIDCVGFFECLNQLFETFLKTTGSSDETNAVTEIMLDPALSHALLIIQTIVMCVLGRKAIMKTVARIWKMFQNFPTYVGRKSKIIDNTGNELLLLCFGLMKTNSSVSNLQDELNQLRSVLTDIGLEVSQGIEKRDERINKIYAELDALKSEHVIGRQHDWKKATQTNETGKTTTPHQIPFPTSATNTLRNPRRQSSLPKTVTRIPLFKDSPKPILQNKIRRCNDSPVTITLAGIHRYNDDCRNGRPTRIPLFENSPRPINVAQ